MIAVAVVAVLTACGGDDSGSAGTVPASGDATRAPSGGPTPVPAEGFILYRDGLGDLVALNAQTQESFGYGVDPTAEVILTAECTADGSQIAFLRQAFDDTDRQLRIDGERGTREIALPSTTQGLTWSPDGTQIALAEFNPQEGYVISTLDLATGDTTEQLRGLGVAASLRWSSDGTRIAFYAPTALAEQIWLFEVGSGSERPTQLTDGPGAYDPEWTPDGERLILSAIADDLSFQIFELDPDTGETTQITESADIFKRLPRFSPDGGTIAYTGSIVAPQVSRDWGALHSFGVFLMGGDGSNERALTVDPRQNPGEGVDPFLDALLIGWCPEGPWLNDNWTPKEALPTIPAQ